MDSILAHLLPRLFAIYEDKHGNSPRIDEMITWDFLNTGETGKRVNTILTTPGVFRSLDPIEGALEGVREILGMGVEGYICSSPGKWTECVPEKSAWLDQHLPEIDYHHRIFAHPKWLVYGDYLIDDSGWNAQQWKQRHPQGKALSITYPYNRSESSYDLLANDHKTPRAAWEQMVEWIRWHKEIW